MAEYVMQNLVNERGLKDQFMIRSAATSREEIGHDAHYGTLQKMKEEGIPTWHRQARQMTRNDYENNDYIILMDDNNWRNAMRIIGSDDKGKVFKAMYFAQCQEKQNAQALLEASEAARRAPRDVKDPWYTGNFDETYRDVVACCEGLLRCLR